MQHSPELGELAGALSAAQGEFEAVSKDSTNPFFKSRYSSLPTVVKSATPILLKHGLSVSQFPGHDDHGHTLTTWLLHKSGQFIADTMRLKPVKDDPQGQGSALTYGRRYSYMAALGLVADEDDDGNAGSTGKPKPPARKPAKPDRGAAKATATEPVQTSKPDSPAPPPEVVAKVRAATTKYGKTADWLMWALAEVGADVTPINDAQDVDSRKAAIAAVIGSLTLEQAVLLVESMGGTAEDLA